MVVASVKSSNEINQQIFLNNTYFKGIESIKPAVKSRVNYLCNMVDDNDDDALDIEKKTK